MQRPFDGIMTLISGLILGLRPANEKNTAWHKINIILNHTILKSVETSPRHDVNIVLIGRTWDCHNDKLESCQWRQIWRHDNSRFSVISNSKKLLHISCYGRVMQYLPPNWPCYPWSDLIPVLLQRSDTVAILSANESAAFDESCVLIGLKSCDNVTWLYSVVCGSMWAVGDWLGPLPCRCFTVLCGTPAVYNV